VFKCLFYNQLVPSVFHSYFVYNNDIHNSRSKRLEREQFALSTFSF